MTEPWESVYNDPTQSLAQYPRVKTYSWDPGLRLYDGRLAQTVQIVREFDEGGGWIGRERLYLLEFIDGVEVPKGTIQEEIRKTRESM